MSHNTQTIISNGDIQIHPKIFNTVLTRIEAPSVKTKFWRGTISKKLKDQYIIGVAHEDDSDNAPMSPGH